MSLAWPSLLGVVGGVGALAGQHEGQVCFIPVTASETPEEM